MAMKKPVNGGAFELPDSIARAKKIKKKQSESQSKLKVLGVCSGTLFGLGTYWLVDPQTLPSWIEVFAIGIAGGVAAYAINAVTITRGAYQAASGVPGATAASVGAILTTGLTISTVSFTGLTINSIDQMEMQEFGRANAIYVDNYIESVRQSDEIVVAVSTGYNQVLAASECERGSSCVSRRGNGGEGQAYHTLNGVAAQIGSVQQSLIEGATVRDDALEDLADANADIQTALNAATGSRKARRAQMQELLSIQRTALADLDRALPLSVVAGLADTLETGIRMPNDRDLTQRINARLAPAGTGISQALDAVDIAELERPDMPPETGVMGALAWIGFYLPLFLMLVLIDTLFPLLLWFFAYSSLRPLVEPEEDDDDIDPFSMTGVLDTPPVLIGPAARQSLGGPPSKGNSQK